MSVKYGHTFKRNYTVQRGFHVILLIAHHAITHDFPDELEVVSKIHIFKEEKKLFKFISRNSWKLSETHAI